MGEETNPESSGERRAFKRSLRQLIADNLWSIIKFVGGAIFGSVAAYLAIWVQVSDAKHAAESAKSSADQLKETVGTLATRDYVDAQKERIDELVAWRLTFREDVQESRKVKPRDIVAAKKRKP